MSRSICTFPGCGRDLHGNLLCKSHRQQQRRTGNVTPLRPAPGTIPLEERFWSQVRRGEGCWIWTGAMRPQGYGVIGINGQTHYAHRISWLIAHGEHVSEGLVIDHICSTPLCVNPQHLRATSIQLNAEYSKRGRRRSPESGARGVYRNRDKWIARVKHRGVMHHLGSFTDPGEAAAAAAAKRAELFQFPEFLGERT